MTVSGLVLTLAEDPIARAHALEALNADPRVLRGEAQGLRLPVVTEAETAEEAEALCEALGRLPGVVFVDVVSIAFSTFAIDAAEVS